MNADHAFTHDEVLSLDELAFPKYGEAGFQNPLFEHRNIVDDYNYSPYKGWPTSNLSIAIDYPPFFGATAASVALAASSGKGWYALTPLAVLSDVAKAPFMYGGLAVGQSAAAVGLAAADAGYALGYAAKFTGVAIREVLITFPNGVRRIANNARHKKISRALKMKTRKLSGKRFDRLVAEINGFN